MVDEIKIDLDKAAPEKKSKVIKSLSVADEMPLPDVLSAREEVEAQKVVTDYQFNASQIEVTGLISQRIGRKAVIDAVTKLLTVTDLIDLQRIKETKSYKGALIVVDGEVKTVITWNDFCIFVEGKSRESVDLEIANLESLGQPTFEALRKIGIGPSTMRSIRQLPEDSRAVIEQVANTSNKDELIDLIDGLVSKHQKEKSTLEAKTKLLEADMNDERKRRDRIEKSLKDVETQLETTEITLEMATRGEGLALVTRNIRAESMTNAGLIGHCCDEILRQWSLAQTEQAINEADQKARERAVLMAVSASLDAVLRLYETVAEQTEIELPLMPDVFDDLTNDERMAAAHSFERMKSQFEVRLAQRKAEAYIDHVSDGGEKKRGRPAKVKGV